MRTARGAVATRKAYLHFGCSRRRARQTRTAVVRRRDEASVHAASRELQ